MQNTRDPNNPRPRASNFESVGKASDAGKEYFRIAVFRKFERPYVLYFGRHDRGAWFLTPHTTMAYTQRHYGQMSLYFDEIKWHEFAGFVEDNPGSTLILEHVSTDGVVRVIERVEG